MVQEVIQEVIKAVNAALCYPGTGNIINIVVRLYTLMRARKAVQKAEPPKEKKLFRLSLVGANILLPKHITVADPNGYRAFVCLKLV